MNRKSIINIAFAVLGVLSLAFFIFNAVIIAVQYGSIDQEDTALLLGTGICPMIICAAAIIASHKSRSLLPDLPIMILSDAAFFFLSRNRYGDEIAEGYVFLPIFLFSLIHLFLQSRKFNTTILFLSIGFYCILTFFISLIMPLLGVICIILASGCFSRLFGKIGDSFDSMRSEKRLLPMYEGSDVTAALRSQIDRLTEQNGEKPRSIELRSDRIIINGTKDRDVTVLTFREIGLPEDAVPSIYHIRACAQALSKSLGTDYAVSSYQENNAATIRRSVL